MQNWGERLHVNVPRDEHTLQMERLPRGDVGSASRATGSCRRVSHSCCVACANLAESSPARTERRHREFAVRTALGATRGRLLRQFMMEGSLLSMAGGALGLVLAYGGVQAFASSSTSLPTVGVTVDPLVLLLATPSATRPPSCSAWPLVAAHEGPVRSVAAGRHRATARAARHHVRRRTGG